MAQNDSLMERVLVLVLGLSQSALGAEEADILEGAEARDCTILNTYAIGWGMCGIIEACFWVRVARDIVPAMLWFRGMTGTHLECPSFEPALPVLRMNCAIAQFRRKYGLACLCGLLFWGIVFGERSAALCCRSDGEEISVTVRFAAGKG